MNKAPGKFWRALACPVLNAIALIVSILYCGGCRSWDPWGKGFDDEYSNLGAKARGSSNNDGTPSLGLSAKSRQIERNLGIQ